MVPRVIGDIPLGTAPAPKSHLPSVLVAVMGPYPMEYYGTTTEAALQKMCAATTGVEANMVYIPDMVPDEVKAQAFDGKGAPPWSPSFRDMKQWAVDQALDLGYSYLFAVDNDAAVSPDTLERLLRVPADIAFPRFAHITFPPVNRIAWGPQAPLGTTGKLNPIT